MPSLFLRRWAATKCPNARPEVIVNCHLAGNGGGTLRATLILFGAHNNWPVMGNLEEQGNVGAIQASGIALNEQRVTSVASCPRSNRLDRQHPCGPGLRGRWCGLSACHPFPQCAQWHDASRQRVRREVSTRSHVCRARPRRRRTATPHTWGHALRGNFARLATTLTPRRRCSGTTTRRRRCGYTDALKHRESRRAVQ
jgi:hypothetical protein